jgi:uncharacterized protein (TIGR00297 family)
MQWLAIYFNIGVTLWAFLRQKLTFSASITALMMGFSVIYFGHELFFTLLMMFFLSSTLIRKILIKLFPHYLKSSISNDHPPRDVIQVLCNGGVLTLLSVFYYLQPSVNILVVASISMAAANADTWASEIGTLSQDEPTSILSRKPYSKGLSGGVTKLGLWASLGGSLLITLISSVYLASSFGLNSQWLAMLFWMTGFGFLGSIVDSILGELFQAKYLDQTGKLLDEKRDMTDQLMSGIAWLDNNAVNLLTNVMVVGTSLILLSLI